MNSSIRPVPQTLSFDDKCYLSRYFVTKEKFSMESPRRNPSGIFIVYGTSPTANLETMLSIKNFLAEQHPEGKSRSDFMYWTKNNRHYVDDSVFGEGEHFTSLNAIYDICNTGTNNFIYMDEIHGGRDFMMVSVLARNNVAVFMSIIADNIEDALYKFMILRPNSNITELNFGSMASNSNESSHLF